MVSKANAGGKEERAGGCVAGLCWAGDEPGQLGEVNHCTGN